MLDLHGVIVQVAAEDLENASGRPGLGIGRGVNDPLQAGVDDGARAHAARFQRGVKCAARQPVIVQRPARHAQGQHLRVGRRIAGDDVAVPALADHLPLAHDYGADRHLVLGLGPLGQREGVLHPVAVGLAEPGRIIHRLISGAGTGA